MYHILLVYSSIHELLGCCHLYGGSLGAQMKRELKNREVRRKKKQREEERLWQHCPEHVCSPQDSCVGRRLVCLGSPPPTCSPPGRLGPTPTSDFFCQRTPVAGRESVYLGFYIKHSTNVFFFKFREIIHCPFPRLSSMLQKSWLGCLLSLAHCHSCSASGAINMPQATEFILKLVLRKKGRIESFLAFIFCTRYLRSGRRGR